MKKKYIIISIISLLIMMVGASYAYFTGMIVGEGAPIRVKANKLAVIFTDTSEIASTQIVPGWSTTKTFTVENKSGGVFYYDINIDNLVNTFVTSGYLQYKITSNDGGYNMEDYLDIPKSNEAKREKLAGPKEIKDKGIHTYKVEFRYLSTEEDQSADMGKIFSGSLSITESEVIIVKYKVEGIIQDTIPDKTEPYIVDKVTCSNNAKGVWNEEKETVELTGKVTQTVCIVEFKAGNSVNIIAENGEVVSPENKVVGRIGSTTFTIEEKEGYELENSKVTCDNGALGSVTGNIVTITNITKDNTCTVTTNEIKYTVTLNIENGSITSINGKTTNENKITVNHGSNVIFMISANDGYKLENAEVTCDNGIYDETTGKLTISNVTSDKVCTIKLVQSKVTFTMNSLACPATINDNSEACYIISHGLGTYFQTKDWDGTATYEGKLYTECIIKNYKTKYGTISGKCVDYDSDGSFPRWSYYDRDGNYWYRNTSDYYASCSVTLECNK